MPNLSLTPLLDRLRAAHAAHPRRLRAAFLGLLVVLLIATSAKYVAKVMKPGDTGQQTRSAFLRWRAMILDVFDGANVYVGSEGVLTAKVFEYLKAHAPILVIGGRPDSAAAMLVKRAGRGVHLGRDESRIADTLLELIEHPAWQKMWLQYCRLETAPADVILRDKQTGTEGADARYTNTDRGAPRLAAYAYLKTGQTGFADRAYNQQPERSFFMLCPTCHGRHDVAAADRQRPCPGCGGTGDLNSCDGLAGQPGDEALAPPAVCDEG